MEEEKDEQLIAEAPMRFQNLNGVNAEPVFPSPFNSRIGNSSVDLKDKANHQKMLDEYNGWWDYGKEKKLGFIPTIDDSQAEERNRLKDEWYQKYHGMPYEDYKNKTNEETGGTNALQIIGKRLDQNFQGLSAPGLGLVDFGMDAAGTLIPGMGKVDDKYDKATMLDNPAHQMIRRISSIVLPTIYLGGKGSAAVNSKLAGGKLFTKPWFTKLAADLTTQVGIDATVLALSDVGEDDSITTELSNMFPETFGPKGRIPLPDFFRTADSDSPGVRKVKNMLESAPFAGVGSVIGAFLDVKNGKKALGWMEPLDETAASYKQGVLQLGGDEDILIRIQEIDELLSLGRKNLSRGNETALINEKLNLQNSLSNIDDVDTYMNRYQYLDEVEADAAIDRKLANNFEQLELDINGLDPDLNADLLSDAAKAKQSVPPGNVARNIADTTAIKAGTSAGDPAPVITDSMRKKGLMVGPTSRDAVMGVAETARDAGRFNAIVDGFRFSAKEMNAAAWGIYNDIMTAGTVDDIKSLFLDNRDVKNLLMGRFKVEVINEEQARAAAFAMRDLVDRFLGREVTASSARVMDTLGREASTIARSLTEMAPFIDDNRAMDLVIDKLQFLMDEYALNKYISGWSLRNKNWFDQIPPGNINEAIETLTDEFTTAQNSIHAKNRKFTRTLKELRKSKPEAIRPLIDAYSHTNGDVDSLAKLYKWAADQITPMGMLRSPDPKNMNLFAKAAWGVRYNNMLSGISAFRAGLGNGAQLIFRPMTALLGHGITGNVDGIKRTIYYNGAVWETNRRALTDAFQMMKKTHQDPTAMMKTFRKDFVFKTDKAWEIMDDMAKLYEIDGNWGRGYQLKMASRLKQIAGMKGLRYGMTAMVFPDVFTTTHLAHYLARSKAYDDVFTEFGSTYGAKAQAALLKAEKMHYDSFFDADGLVRDKTLRSMAGEIQLNLDDGLATFLNQGTTAYPILKEVMAFPRTASQFMKAGASWTPISLIPGISKYSKTIYAKTADDIAAALAEHGIDVAKETNAQVIFENLRAEYVGRMAFSSLLTSTLFGYAMGGNIRGNGHYNASRRNKERDEMGYVPKTIKIGNNWVSFKGIIGLEHMLTIIGDLAYYAGDIDEHLLESWESKLAWTIGATFLNESPLAGIEPLFDAINGNVRAFNRLVSQSASSWIPASGGLGVISNAIDTAQKDIDGEIIDFVKNRLPGFKSTLPNQIDIWTGQPLNDIDNPWLKALNALSPIKVSSGAEDWRIFLQDIGYNGTNILKMDTTGSYEWKPEDRELINQYIGEQELFKQVKRLMKNKAYQQDIKDLKSLRSTQLQLEPEKIALKTTLLPIHKKLNSILRESLKQAEARYLRDHPHVQQSIYNAQRAKQRLGEGDVKGAGELQKKDIETQNLINMRK